MVLKDLMGVLNDPIPNSIFHPEAIDIRQVVTSFQDILGIPASLTISKGAKQNRRHDTAPTATAPLYQNGTIIRKTFQVNGITSPYEGEIKSYDPINKWYHIVYKDGDTEDFTATEVKKHKKLNQQYSRAPRVEPIKLIGGLLSQSIPTITAPTQQVEPLNLIGGTLQRHNQSIKVNRALGAQLHTALLAGAIWDPDLNKWMRYKDLINHPDPAIRRKWMEAGED